MSDLILPPGVAPPPPDPMAEVPPAIAHSLALLMDGIEANTLVAIRRRMDDSGDQIVYDLAVAVLDEQGKASTISLARLFPQPPLQVTDGSPAIS